MFRSIRSLRPGLSYANVMATAAVFIALGGSAWAVAANSVGPKQIQMNAARAKHIKKKQVRAKHVKRNAIRAKHLRDGAVTSAKLAEGVAISGPKGDQGPPGPKGDSAFQADCNEGLPGDDVMVRVGSVCIDRYEASVWDAPTGGNQLVTEAQIDAACPMTDRTARARSSPARSPVSPPPATSPGFRPSRR